MKDLEFFPDAVTYKGFQIAYSIPVGHGFLYVLSVTDEDFENGEFPSNLKEEIKKKLWEIINEIASRPRQLIREVAVE
jgi:hypothetical protein